MSDLTAVGLGEVLFDVVNNKYLLGGAPANFAWHCHMLGLKAYAVAAVGSDELGAKAISLLGDLAQGISVAEDVNGQAFATGCVRAQIDGNGVASYSFDEDCAFDHLVLNARQSELARNCSLVCFGTLCQRHQMSQKAIYEFLSLADKALRIFDVNLRGSYFNQGIIKSSLNYCDIVKVSDEELPRICELLGVNEGSASYNLSIRAVSFFDFLRQNYQVSGLILTKGAAGSEIFYKDEHSLLLSPTIKLADTIGAGDSFDAAFGSALIKGASLKDAHALANEVSAYVCTKSGAMVNLDPSFAKKLEEIAQS